MTPSLFLQAYPSPPVCSVVQSTPQFSTATPNLLVVIDPGLQDTSMLAAGVIAGATGIILEPDRDGVEQITEALHRYQPTSLHILAHGSPGCLYLGNTRLNLETIDRYTPALQSWFSSPAQLLLYGCRVAAGATGAEFLQRLHQVTGANIAASRTLVGSTAQGGQWELEVRLGEVNCSLAIEAVTQQRYPGLFVSLPPILSLISNAPDTINRSFTVVASFSSPVTGFDSSDVTLTNGSISNFRPINDSLYLFDVTPDAEGLITVDVAANVAEDDYGIPNPAAAPLSRTYDRTVPTASLSTTAASTVSTPFTVTATFSETVNGFTEKDLAIANGSVSNFTTVNGSTYTFQVNPDKDGPVSVDLAANVAQDGAGNFNTAATSLSRTFDGTAPTVSLTSTAPALVGAPFVVAASFTEAVQGFTVEDLAIGNGSASNFTAVDGSTYTFQVTPGSDGPVTVDVAASSALDQAGNANTAAQRLSRTFDSTAPTVNLSSTAGKSVNAAFTVIASFSETVSGFDSSDLAVGNGKVSNFSAINATTYQFDIQPSSDGLVTVDVAANAAQDGAGRSNIAAQLSLNYDGTAPTIILASPVANTVNASFGVTASFSEAVVGFDSSYLIVNNGSVINFAAVNSTTYSFEVVPQSEGAVTVEIPTGAVQDQVGNSNALGASLSRTFSSTASDPAPTADIIDVSPDPRQNSVSSVAIQFSEAVKNFDLTDLTLTRDGSPVSLTTATLASQNNTTWLLGNLDSLTEAAGTYKLTLATSDITDLLGTSLASSVDDVWQISTATNPSVTNPGGGTTSPTGSTATGSGSTSGSTGGSGTGTSSGTASTKDSGTGSGTGTIDGKVATAPSGINFKAGKRGIRLHGTSHKDKLHGTSRKDKIWGGRGSDRIYGSKGNDRIYGNKGNDTIMGDDGNDQLRGGSGNDLLLGGSGDDVLIGGSARNTLTGGSGNDLFVFGSEVDNVITDFDTAQDLIDLRPCFTQPGFSGTTPFSRFNQFVKLEQVGANTQVKLDLDGNGKGTALATLATLNNVSLSSISSRNFVVV